MLTDRERQELYSIAAEAWVESGFDEERAKEIARNKLEQRYGSLLGALQLIAVLLEICYILFRFWKERNVTVPPFELYGEAKQIVARAVGSAVGMESAADGVHL